MTTPTADPATTATELDDNAAEVIRYGQALDKVTVERDRATALCTVLQTSLGRAWARVDKLNRVVTEADARAERYRHQLDLANTERARLAEEVAVLRAAVTELVDEPVVALVCRSCGCHDLLACQDGCVWATDEEQRAAGITPTGGPLCTACLGRQAEVLAEQQRPWWRRWLGV
ncbi:hypothetical protein AB0M35_18120 [Micromonospora sp. NPDC051196]|uniref:hypothetical protein n=1 Tax=Micromonospora sp. NPDC051196 TaxID=3155281 RepID=UPI00343AC8D9